MTRTGGLCLAAFIVCLGAVAARGEQRAMRQTPDGTTGCTTTRVIPNFNASFSDGVFTMTWDRPANADGPVYEVVRSTSSTGYCSFPPTETVIAKTTTTSYAASLSIPNVAYRFYIQLSGDPCTRTQFNYVIDSFTTLAQKPPVPAVTTSGNQVTLTFSYSDQKAFSVVIQRAAAGGNFTSIGERFVCAGDPKTFSETLPAGVYQYRIGVLNGAGGIVSDPVTVTVGTPLSIDSFTATPAAIRAGQSATLSFVTTGATSVLIDNGIGAQRSSGTVTVTPSQTTTYTLTASSGNSTLTSSVTVQVNTQPSVSVSQFPEALIQATGASGATSSYNVTNNGGGTTTVTAGQNGNFFTQSPTSFTLAPGASQTVTLQAGSVAAGAYDGFATLSGNGVPAGLQVPVRLLVAAPPAASVTAKAIDNRVDVSAAAGSNPSGAVRFTNTGAGVLTGTVVASVPWLIPQVNVVTIPPGGTVSVPFTIDRTKRSDSDALFGSTTGNLSLYYISRSGAGKGAPAPNQAGGGAPVTVSKASVVDTVPPATTAGGPPALTTGEVALFVAGLGHAQGTVGLFISDLSILNPLSNRSVDDIRLFYTPITAASPSDSRTANVQLASTRALTVGDAVKTAFGQETLGTLQIRSRDAAKLAVNATVFNSSNPAGTYGTAIPTIRSDRSAGSGSSVAITGLRRDSSSHTNLYIQEVSGNGITVGTEFIAADGTTVSTRSDDLGPFALKTLGSIVPDRAVSAILTLTSGSGRFQAFATPVDDASGDTWTVADWSSFYGYSPGETTIIPVAGVLAGAGNTFFRTDAAIMNRGTGQASGTLRFFGRNGEVLSRTVTLGGRQASIISDIIGTLFNGPNGSVGYISFTPTTGTFAITSRTYTTVAGQAATFGTGVPTLAATSALRRGTVRPIANLEDAELETIQALRPGTFRTNYGLLETSGNSAKVRVTVKFSFPAGPKTTAVGSATKDYDLAPNQFLLVNGLTADVLGAGRSSLGDLRNIEADFQVIDGDGAVMVFTSSVDNGTADTILRTD